ncbi:MAG: DUF4358 domain-containing protein [Lachnospiraceae bacterium]|nr:DUF4358 domain-containing protein [Lachnospiraceae bacterium]
MKQFQFKRVGILAGMAAFILCVFIWGALNWQRTSRTVIQIPDYQGSDYQNAQREEEPQQTASGKAVDIDQLTEDLLNDIEYDTELEEMEESVATGMLELQKKSEITLYMGDGTCSDQILIVTSDSEQAAEKDQKAVEQYLMEMKKSFEDYIPEQAAKIEDAVIIRCGCYVTACVTEQAEDAKEIIVKAFK